MPVHYTSEISGRGCAEGVLCIAGKVTKCIEPTCLWALSSLILRSKSGERALMDMSVDATQEEESEGVMTPTGWG